jgi:putative spermidine/putrescine transport system permease protein
MALRAAAGVSLAYILLPMFFVVWLAFFAQEIPSFPPEGYSLKWFRAVPGNDRFVKGFLLSLQVAVVSTSIGLAIGVPAAVCLVRGRFAGREAMNNLLLLPLIVPGIVLGIALYVFHVETEIVTGWPILGSLGGLVAGHVLIAIPWTVRLITASLVGMDRAVEEAAQNLGADRLTTFRRITLPAILPGIVAAALFGFAQMAGAACGALLADRQAQFTSNWFSIRSTPCTRRSDSCAICFCSVVPWQSEIMRSYPCRIWKASSLQMRVMAREYGPYEQRHSGIWFMIAAPSTSQPMAPTSAQLTVG